MQDLKLAGCCSQNEGVYGKGNKGTWRTLRLREMAVPQKGVWSRGGNDCFACVFVRLHQSSKLLWLVSVLRLGNNLCEWD